LREQTHEHANHLHAIRGLLALGEPEEALQFLERLETAHHVAYGSISGAIEQHVVAGLLLAEIAVAQQLSPMPAAVSVGVPSELLERRPDVIAAERRVAAAFNRIGEAKAAMLPRISLTAGGSSISSDVFVLQDRSNPAFSFGANLLAPIYQGGTLRAQVDVRTAEQKEAVASYARTAQRSFAEVENALAAENALRDRDAILDANINDNIRALDLVQIQYRVGSVDFRAVAQNQLALYNARMSLLRVQTERRAQRVNLYLALGGGFDAPAMEPVAAQQ